MSESQSPTLDRLADQIEWYDRRSQDAQRWFKILKLLQVAIAATITMVGVLAVPEPGKIAASLSLVIIILEGIQHVNQYHANWITYRSTCEALKHEKYLYLAKAGPYANLDAPLRTLADRIEGLISQEHAKWISAQEQAKRAPHDAAATAGQPKKKGIV